MKQILLVLLFLAWLQEAACQVPWDSIHWEEKEDSLSSLSIKPIKRPKKLLKQVLTRLLLDMQQKQIASKYQIEAIFGEGSSTPFSVCCIFSAEAGFGLENVRLEMFHYEGPLQLTRQDTISIESFLMEWVAISPVRMHKSFFAWNGVKSSRDVLRETIEGLSGYDIKAYSISSGSGGGVYRISFAPEKERTVIEITATAFFDIGTLRMSRFKGETHMPYSHNRLHYQIDYSEKGRTPVVEQIKIVGTKDNVAIKAIVRKVNE